MSVVHVLRDRRSRGADRRDAGIRRCRCGNLQYGCRLAPARHRDGEAARPEAPGRDPRRPVRPKRRPRCDRRGSRRPKGLFVLDDAAQGFGASCKGRRIGSLGLATATSFFPTKPLGCFGDGGAIFTDDDKLAETLRSIRVHGQGSDKYDNVRLGLTGRPRHPAGGGPDREAEDFRGRDRGPQPRGGALCARSRQSRDGAAAGRRLHLDLGAVHHPPAQGDRS